MNVEMDNRSADDPRAGTGSRVAGEPELELAARVSDQAGADTHSQLLTSAEGETLDVRYRRALEDIACLVDLRREAAPRAGIPASDTSLPKWGPFELVEQLGVGASGEVFKALDTHLGHHVAVKLFHQDLVDEADRESLLVEGRRHALVKHPNIAMIYGADVYHGRLGIWLEYVDGATLQALVARQGPFGADEAIQIGQTLCSAVAAVHQQGLTHGDIKAQNVMRQKGGRIVLMDFSSSRSVSKLDETPALVGTPIYMAPELFDGSPPSFASDVYALGVLLFYLVTGAHPVEARTLDELKQAVSLGPPRLLADLRPELPAAFVEAVHRAIALDPAKRYASVGRLQAALRASLVANDSIPTPPAPSGQDVSSIDELKELATSVRVLSGFVLVSGFLALLGYLNEFHFNVTLQIPEEFTGYSLMTAVMVGFRSLIPAITLLGLESGAVFALWALSILVPLRVRRSPARALRGMQARLEVADPVRLAAGFTFLSLLGLGAACYAFSDLLGLFIELGERGLEQAGNVRLLCTTNDGHLTLFSLAFAQLVLLLSAGWFTVFTHSRKRKSRGAAFGLMRIASAGAILVAIAVMAGPWKLFWKSDVEIVRLEGKKAFVLASNRDDLYVYAPEAEPDRRRVTVGRRDGRVAPDAGHVESVFCEAR